MTTQNLTRLMASVAFLAGLAACSDAPNAPVAAGQPAALAASFDAMAQEEAALGRLDQSNDWRWVAYALRHGVEPSHIEIWTYGKMEDYDAFVRATETPAINTIPNNEAGHIMLAWQRHNSERINHVLRLSTPGDNGRIVPHGGIHSGIVTGAHVDYAQRGAALGPWSGFEGVAQIAEQWAGGRCVIGEPSLSSWRPPEGMLCQKATFLVRFEATFMPMNSEAPTPESHIMNMWMAEQRVIGIKLTPGTR